MAILATGGAGYIGSHTVLELLKVGYDVVVLDNLGNSSEVSLRRVAEITSKEPVFIQGDVNDPGLLADIFSRHNISAVVHFAGLKAAGESVEKPLDYYRNNVGGTVNLCQAMAAAGVFRLVFSSSATVYGEQPTMPLKETTPTGKLTNPYGRSKRMIEEILQDMADSDNRWSVALLRYFNPVGAHESGLIGEDPCSIPNNLLPYICQVAVGKRPELLVYGDDYPTMDGTGVRDYIHVVDLAKGHLAALGYLHNQTGVGVWNLGTGRGYSVLEIVKAFAAAAQRPVLYRIVARRVGDIAECWSDPGKAWHELGWKAEKGLVEMMADAWRWQSRNPNGYRGS